MDFRFWILDFGLINTQSPITNHQSPITNHQLPNIWLLQVV
ncbi:hypothetical protein [Sphaerospermopsis sp. FACHB-1094]|nr:hypothetical protein [Sphaerospermopsis sp. FACHB-1094]